MNDNVLIAILSLCGTLLGTMGGIVATNKLVTYRLEQLEKKVQAHNNLVTRMYQVEKQQGELAQRVDMLHRHDE